MLATKTTTTVSQLKQLPSHKFNNENSIKSARLSYPIAMGKAGEIIVHQGYKVLGWCKNMPANLMINREGQSGLMLYHEEYGDVWMHLPLYDQDDYGRAFIRTNVIL